MTITSDDDADERSDRLEREIQCLAQENRTLADRIERAEHHARSKRYVICLLLLAGVFAIVAGRAVTSGRSKIVEAEWFALRDKNGNRRAVLQVTPEGSTVLAFYDRNGKNLLQIFEWHDGSVGMNVLDTSGKVRVAVGDTRDGTMGLAVYDGSGRIRIENALGPDGAAALTVFDSNGKPSFRSPAMSDKGNWEGK